MVAVAANHSGPTTETKLDNSDAEASSSSDSGTDSEDELFKIEESLQVVKQENDVENVETLKCVICRHS